MTNMTITPNPVVEAANSTAKTLEAYGIETQVFFSDVGAVILTDQATYEVYRYDGGIIVQMMVADGNGWSDVTGTAELLAR